MWRTGAILLLCGAMHRPAPAAELSPEVRALEKELIELRRDFHAHPEPGFQEHRTSMRVAEYLEGLGLEVVRGVAKTGVVATLGTPGEKTLLIRADMDALSLTEENDVPYESQTPGVMHACGHDGHTAAALIAAKILSREAKSLRGQVKLVFQPAEEGPGGAEAMIEAGVLESPKVTAAIGFHLYNNLEVGTVGVREGAALASADRFEVAIQGKGGHGGMPQLSVDSILIAGQTLSALQSVISRETDPFQPAVVSVGTIHGGSAFNVIADSVEMTGTVRTYDVEVQSKLRHSLERIVTGVSASLGGTATLDYQVLYPPVVNDDQVTRLVRSVAVGLVGESRVIRHPPSMAGDDMAFLLQKVPGCYFFVGSANAARGLTFPHHHPRFDFDETALGTAVEMLVRGARQYLN